MRLLHGAVRACSRLWHVNTDDFECTLLCLIAPRRPSLPYPVQLRLPRRVLGTALTYLKRIYVSHSCLEHDPQQLLLTCLYLACKVGAGRCKLGSCTPSQCRL